LFFFFFFNFTEEPSDFLPFEVFALTRLPPESITRSGDSLMGLAIRSETSAVGQYHLFWLG